MARLAADVLPALMLLILLATLLCAYSGTWPPMVSVTSGSMEPHLHVGDLVMIKSPGITNVTTSRASLQTHYETFGDYGDVIVYRPLGMTNVTPVIHRAMYWVDKGEPMWPAGPAAPESGYITLGDNNHGSLDQFPGSGICPLQPIRPEWVIGVAQYSVPYLGYVRSIIPI